MITHINFKKLLRKLDFSEQGSVFSKYFPVADAELKVDFDKQRLIYPEDKGLIVNEKQTCNFSANENFVVFECVHCLLEKGYKPEHLELEPKWKLGHGASGGRADILVKDNAEKSLLIIECKTSGREFNDAWKQMLYNGGQLFSYAQQVRSTQFVCLYASDFEDNKVVIHNYIVILRDNEKFLEERKDQKSGTYRDAQSVEELFKAWKETYAQDYAVKGIFEDDIQPYHIGKDKYSEKDLRTIGEKDIQPKYHEFATILRQHNVSGRENAFDKLVNLFLCKIVDEKNNPDDLKFYWKGIAYDTFFDLIDRLQRLYRDGMKEFLKEPVTYIDNQTIKDAFKFFKNDPDATRDKILHYFREQKYFTNNDFSFIDVHNERLFYQNAAVLLKIVLMLQDIRLNGDQQNQFLGDMFEFFLDQGFKQSEGQFFTPMPVTKFILMSLPLEKIIKDSQQPPKTIDYACGAGHFLNELAVQIKPFVKKHKSNDIREYYRQIFGIEKEYRLSKVAKVSAFMYSQDEINIIYSDALAAHEQINDGSFMILTANPPYSVKGFLETLAESDRKCFKLIETIDEKTYHTHNAIETFFIERSKQLLAPGGVAGIIVPSSILSNSDSTYIAAREILLKYFDIIALAEFGSGTFGKTGTNTVTLFLRRKDENPAPSDHYRNRVEAWFNGDHAKDAVFEDRRLLKKYCEHIEIAFEDYQTLLQGKPGEKLMAYDMFREYRKDFESLTQIRNLKAKKSFKDKSEAEQQADLQKYFLEYLHHIEKDKAYYFVLAITQPNKVLIVKSPSENKAQKQFLGYEWSAAKGNEGIKLFTDADGKHLTPLYDPDNRYNPQKINCYIQQNFTGEDIVISETLQEYLSLSPLADMLDFRRKDFNKQISLMPKKSSAIESRWDLVKLGDVTEIIAGQSPPSQFYNEQGKGLPFYQGKKDFGQIYLTEPAVWTTQITKESIENDILVSVRAPVGDVNINPFNKICIGRGLAAIRTGNAVIQKFLFELMAQNKKIFQGHQGAAFESISRADLTEIKIPLPPLSVQAQIAAECEATDATVAQAQAAVIKAKNEIEERVSGQFSKAYTEKNLSAIAVINPSKSEIRDVDENTSVSFIEMASVSNNGFIANKEDRLLKTLKKGSYTYFCENDIIIAKITPCMENGKCALAQNLTNGLAMGSSEFHVIRTKEEVLNKYVFYMLNRKVIRKEAERNMTGSSGHRRVPASFYENIKIPVPPIKVQQQLLSEIEASEAKIREAQAVIVRSAAQKQAVMKKYL